MKIVSLKDRFAQNPKSKKTALLAFSVRPSVVNPADSCPGSKEATESGIAKTALSPAPACKVHTESELCQRRRFERKCNQYFHLPEKFSNSICQNCLLSCLARAKQCWTGWGQVAQWLIFCWLGVAQYIESLSLQACQYSIIAKNQSHVKTL